MSALSSTSTPCSQSGTASPSISPTLSRTSSSTSISGSDDNASPKISTESGGPIRARAADFDPVTKICFVGAGYVGGPTAAVLAFSNPQIQVTVVDRDSSRISRWQSKHLPIHEPGLDDIVRVARDGTNATILARGSAKESVAFPERTPNLFFSTDCEQPIGEADIIFLSVNTPTKLVGVGAGAATNISIFESAMRSIAVVAKPGAIIVEKSTVPCRTAQVIRDILDIHRPGVPFEILSNPEFLAEGTAISDLLHPSRVLIGSSNTSSGLTAAARLALVYNAWVPEASILNVHLWSSELAKLVANAMLAQRISSINTVSAICEKTGADVSDIASAIGMDHRIGAKFLHAGLGFGGSCFKKDILSLSYLAESLDLPEVAAYWKSVVDINVWQCERLVKRVIKSLNGSLTGKKLAILGYAFKKDTSDTRESQSISVIEHLLRERPAEIAIYDPGCTPADICTELQALFGAAGSGIIAPEGPINVHADPYTACTGSSAVLILTDWDQFRYPPLSQADSSAAAVESYVHTALARLAQVQVLPEDWDLNAQQTLFRSQPQCNIECTKCNKAPGALKSYPGENLKWEEVGRGMKMPRWVFDARGVLDAQGLEDMGFRVESVGKVGKRSRLRGFEVC
ncbi:nucleotide sugar dehydrogenase [Pseudovirgaria hyperparasitica]|uniref:UDP-glucose 6-dehydrogenase n=1 Tax=Pseudovirgaria hyperparasitica TaxID=470096 RepID=A0A6A6VT22_9PEZI|nr:nucleotide sugar dehydrogenase [Pseudovirgaria hyperparasitica]KAF2752904.1 nucleotide sugar dehydrogenase [Pseudovirgaria hyperparasitica]